MEDWAEIRRLHMSEGVSIKGIVRRLGVARNTVRAALASDEPPRYERERSGSLVDEFEPQIRVLLAATPSMPASVIGERIGWEQSASVLRARVALLRPLYAPSDPADRTAYRPGDIVQCDLWFPAKVVPVAAEVLIAPPVLTMVAAWSGFIAAVLLPTRQSADLLAPSPPRSAVGAPRCRPRCPTPTALGAYPPTRASLGEIQHDRGLAG